jgi:hypothetical protein
VAVRSRRHMRGLFRNDVWVIPDDRLPPHHTSVAFRQNYLRAVVSYAELTEAGPFGARLEALIEELERFRSPVQPSARTPGSLGNMPLLADWLRTVFESPPHFAAKVVDLAASPR